MWLEGFATMACVKIVDPRFNLREGILQAPKEVSHRVVIVRTTD
jgi:hypothetical protein